MKLLSALLEEQACQEYINANEGPILEAAEQFHETPQKVKDYIFENLHEFVVPGDLNATYEKMVIFAESCAVQTLNELSSNLIGQ